MAKYNKQLLDEVFVICRIINVEVRVISRAGSYFPTFLFSSILLFFSLLIPSLATPTKSQIVDKSEFLLPYRTFQQIIHQVCLEQPLSWQQIVRGGSSVGQNRLLQLILGYIYILKYLHWLDFILLKFITYDIVIKLF